MPIYLFEYASVVANKIAGIKNLPAFTMISGEKSYLNKSRMNLYSMLLPIEDRAQAMKDFIELSKEWNKIKNECPNSEIDKF